VIVLLLVYVYDAALQIAAGLKYLHSHNIIFRDLKPANIGFDVRGDVKLFDFGLARIMPDDGCPYTDTFFMSGAGSPRYMAPECLTFGESYNMKADIYSFAIILWEMLSASQPYAFVRRRDELIQHVGKECGRIGSSVFSSSS
jgi:serine/threonine protein kinase